MAQGRITGKKVPIPYKDEGQFFHQIVRVLGGTVISSIKNREMDVLAELLRVHNRYKQYSPDVKWKLVFHKDTKQEIKERLQMSRANFDNHIASLKRKNILQGESIDPRYIITLDGSEYNLIFRFRSAEDQDQQQQDQTQRKSEPKAPEPEIPPTPEQDQYQQRDQQDHETQETTHRDQEGNREHETHKGDVPGDEGGSGHVRSGQLGRRSEPQGPPRRSAAPEPRSGSDDEDHGRTEPRRHHATVDRGESDSGS